MKSFAITTIALLISLGSLHSETLDQAVARYLAGEKISSDEVAKLTNTAGHASEGGGVKNNGSLYLNQVKLFIISPFHEDNVPLRSNLLREARSQQKTYRELKAIYLKNKTPLVAYAMVCPAMYADDMELLPELFAKIAEHKRIKAKFDSSYKSYWKPHLDPDF